MMDWYYHKVLKPWLFRESRDDNEKAHEMMLEWLQHFERWPGLCRFLQWMYNSSTEGTETHAMGLTFKNPVVLAAGIDKNCVAWNALSILGAGGIDHGGVVPLPQEGNSRKPNPRLFRLENESSVINSQGFPSDGMEVVKQRIIHKEKGGTLRGCNLGRNKDTPSEETADDMCKTMTTLYPYFDWFTVNVSSPNTPGLRGMQDLQPFEDLIDRILNANEILAVKYNISKRKIRVKFAPDLPNGILENLVVLCMRKGVDCVVLGNTKQTTLPGGDRPAGKSGPSLYPRTLEMVQLVAPLVRDYSDRGLVACGGIDSPEKAIEVLDAGADLVEILTTLFFDGPGQPGRIVQAIHQHRMAV